MIRAGSVLTAAGALLLLAGLFLAWRSVIDVGALPSPTTPDWRADDAEPEHVPTGHGEAPRTFNEMVRQADAVGIVRMDTADADEITGQKRDDFDFTGFQFTVVQPIAGDLHGGEQVVIWRQYRPLAEAWAVYDNSGPQPVLMEQR